MKKLLGILIVILFSISIQAQIQVPRESQSAKVNQTIGFTEIQIEYTRPNVKGRKLFGEGEMIPYGTVWRTGANANTKFYVSKDVFLNGNRIPAGKYAIYSIPNKGDWTMIVSKDTTLWGHYGYDEKNDFLRFQVTPETTLDHHETFTIGFEGVDDKRATLEIVWGKHRLPMELKIDEEAQDAQIVADIKKTLSLPDDRNEPMIVAHDYFHAAQYYNETDRDPEQALKWFDKAIKIQDVSYFHLYKSELLGKIGRYADAIKASKRGLDIFMVKATNKEWIWRYEEQIKKWEKMKSGD